MGIIFQPLGAISYVFPLAGWSIMRYHLGRFNGLAIKEELFRVVTDFKLGGKTRVFRTGDNAGRTLGIIRAAIF